jgi:hypothetical protein
MVGCYCDDVVVVARDEAAVNKFLTDLKNCGFEFTK